MIGTLVTWPNVPSGALVRGERSGDWYVRIGDCGWVVNISGGAWVQYSHYIDEPREDAGWEWEPGGTAVMRIAALGLTGDESAEALKGLAESFEQRFPWEGA